ncbi:MAG: blue light sensor protein [Variovorax paradoxus]|uniref:Blue light sensor protein n=1 Tax=Variovorax paradoxus TaxID=34073 RepID=A0A2W5P8Y9_VARPD|nr:MAG: blue light sensor protein [Variovorax paradoxus]
MPDHTTPPTAPSPLYEFLYWSQLADSQSPTAIGQILARARPFNASNGITGLLVFDGQRFCQHLEGPTAAVEGLMGRIAADERHSELRIAYEGPLAERRYHRFDMGYAQAEDPLEMEQLALLRGEAALQRFLALRPSFDIQS